MTRIGRGGGGGKLAWAGVGVPPGWRAGIVITIKVGVISHGACSAPMTFDGGNLVQVMREGKDITLVAFGKLVGYNLKAAEILAEDDIDCEVPSSLLVCQA